MCHLASKSVHSFFPSKYRVHILVTDIRTNRYVKNIMPVWPGGGVIKVKIFYIYDFYAVVQLVEYRTHNREVAGSTHTRSTATNLEQVANLLCAQANSASYPQRDGK